MPFQVAGSGCGHTHIPEYSGAFGAENSDTKKFLTKLHVQDIVLVTEGETLMTKSIFAILALVLTAGCSETNVYESDNTGDAGSSSGGSGGSDTGTSNTGNSSTGGSGSGSTGTGAGTGTDGGTGGGTSVDDLVPETCLEAGKRISGLDNHPACGTVIDRNGSTMSCPTTCNGYQMLECGGAFWDTNKQNPTQIAEEFAASSGYTLYDRFATATFTNICGEGCVNADIPDGQLCPSGQKVAICGWDESPSNCTLLTDNVWCCNSNAQNYTIVTP